MKAPPPPPRALSTLPQVIIDLFHTQDAPPNGRGGGQGARGEGGGCRYSPGHIGAAESSLCRMTHTTATRQSIPLTEGLSSRLLLSLILY